MEFNEIDTYLHKILKKQLQRLKISNNGLYAILNNVKTQMYSYINNYNDIDFRHALLVTTMEEGKFYEPIINEELGSFVVLTIRNSLLEVIASIDYHEYGLTTAIKDEHIREITSKAIEYFKDVNFINLSKKITVEDDYYRELEKIYPNAFSSLILLGKCTKENPSIQYQPKEMKKYELKELDKDKLNIQKVNKENGYSLNLNDNLIYIS